MGLGLGRSSGCLGPASGRQEQTRAGRGRFHDRVVPGGTPPQENTPQAPRGLPPSPTARAGEAESAGGGVGKMSRGRPGPTLTTLPPPPKGPTAPDPGRTGGPRGVFKPPRRDALGTWKGGRESERTGRGTGGGERDPRPLTATNLRRRHRRRHHTRPTPTAPAPAGPKRLATGQPPPRGGGPRSRLRAFQPPPQHTHTHTPPRTPPTAPRPACPTPARPRPLATQGEGRRREAGCRAWRGDGAARWGRRGKVGGGEGKEDTRDGRGRGDPEAAAAGRGDPGQQTPGWGGTGGAAGARGSGARGRPSPPPVSYTHLTLPTMPVRCRSRWSPYH